MQCRLWYVATIVRFLGKTNTIVSSLSGTQTILSLGSKGTQFHAKLFIVYGKCFVYTGDNLTDTSFRLINRFIFVASRFMSEATAIKYMLV